MIPNPLTAAVAPFMLWTALAAKTSEMLLASAYVIGHRTGRMAAAGPRPGARDRREFERMGQEKIDAAVASTLAMSAEAWKSQLELGAQSARQAQAATRAMLALGTSRTPSEAWERYARFTRILLQTPHTTNSQLKATARLLGRGLHPVHARATANSRRLRKL